MTGRILVSFAVAAALVGSRGAGRPISAPVLEPTADAARRISEARMVADGRAIGSAFVPDDRSPESPPFDRDFVESLLRTPDLQHAYQGDGRFTDGGDRAAYDRYVLDLGVVRFDVPGRSEYRCAGLPPIRLTFGFDIRTPELVDSSVFDTASIRARVRLRVVRTEGDVVMDVLDRLDKWTWSGTGGKSRRSFVYRRGRSENIRAADGRERSVEIGVRTDEGWGTYFTPRERQAYRVTLEVLKPDPSAAGFEIRLKAAGGGWKS